MSSESQVAAGVYLAPLQAEAVRILGLMDRDPLSPTRGCMDRTHWAWKFTDFPGARFQEGLCFLSFFYSTAFEGNPYYQQPKLLAWIDAGFSYWCSIQYKGGHFDEAYPYEHSLAATAFTSFYLAEAYGMLGDALPEPTRRQFLNSLAQAAEWLDDNDEKHGVLTNHLGAAAAAALHAGRILDEDRFKRRGQFFLERILSHQSKEGWYEEYGGADPGYQTHGTFYLARCLELSPDDRLAESLDRSLEFLANFVHPDGSLGGEYASRNTQFYYPAAFEMLSNRNGTARWIAETMLPSVTTLAAAGGRSVDAYNWFPLLNNYVFAYKACESAAHRSVPSQAPADEALIHYPEAGLVRRRTSTYDLYVGLHKGGVVKAFNRKTGKLALNDCGYVGRLKKGTSLSSQVWNPDRKTSVGSDEIRVEGQFSSFKRPVMKPVPFVGFRVFTLTFGRLRRISYLLKSLLVRVLIYRRSDLDLELVRRIRTEEATLIIEDRLQGSAGRQVDRLVWADVFTTIHMGSSRYFLPNELGGDSVAYLEQLDPSRLESGITIERRIDFSEK